MVDGNGILTMAVYFSISNDGFFDSDSGVPVPGDAILLTEEQYHMFLSSMNHENKKLTLDNDGKLILVERETVISWDMIRRKRNRLLRLSDHKVTPDYPSDKEAWMTYRKQLRDITISFTDPIDVVWPVSPDEGK